MPSRVARSFLMLVLLLAAPLFAAPRSFLADDGKPKPDAPSPLPALLVTIQQKGIPVSKAILAFAEQTKVGVALPEGDDPKLNLDLKAVPFWKALDEIAKEADMRVYPYMKDGKLALRKGYREIPTSYSGPFRVTLKRVGMVRDLESDARYGAATLEIAWHPPFQGFFLQTRPDGLVVKDDKGLDLELPNLGKVQTSLAEKPNACEIDVPLPAVRRAVPQLALIKGSLPIIGSARMLTFPLELKKGQEKTIDGVTVKLTDVDAKEADLWALQFHLKYPGGGPNFESFQLQDWLQGNQAVLVKPGMRFVNNATGESDVAPAGQALLTHRFADDPDKKLKLGKVADWKVEYTTPSPVLQTPIPFEFKDVPLP